MDLSTLGSGGGGWKCLFPSIPANFQNLPQGELLRVTPTSDQSVRLTFLGVWATSGGVPNVSVSMGARKIFDRRVIGAVHSMSGSSVENNIGRGNNCKFSYIEGKKGEALVITSENVGGVGNYYLTAAYEIGVYE